MVYDFDDCEDKSPPRYHPSFTSQPADPRDLETIVNLLEIAALSLTTATNVSFTKNELLCEAQAFGGEIVLEERDVNIVLPHLGFLKKLPGKRLQLR